jgi:hypothetical protein
MAPGTDGNLISYDTSGNPVAVATGNDGQVLTSAGAGAVPTFETLPAGTTLSGSTNNTVATVTGANALAGEANLTFDGSILGVTGTANIISSNSITNPVIINRTSDDGKLISFQRNGTEIGKLDTVSNGLRIYLGGTAAANALDDYEEGVWTPSLGGNTSYVVQVGKYTKIGQEVSCHFRLKINSLGTGQPARIYGLPFTGANFAYLNTQQGIIGYFAGIQTAVTSLVIYTPNNSTELIFANTAGNLTNINNSPNIHDSGSEVYGSIVYTAA